MPSDHILFRKSMDFIDDKLNVLSLDGRVYVGYALSASPTGSGHLTASFQFTNFQARALAALLIEGAEALDQHDDQQSAAEPVEPEIFF